MLLIYSCNIPDHSAKTLEVNLWSSENFWGQSPTLRANGIPEKRYVVRYKMQWDGYGHEVGVVFPRSLVHIWVSSTNANHIFLQKAHRSAPVQVVCISMCTHTQPEYILDDKRKTQKESLQVPIKHIKITIHSADCCPYPQGRWFCKSALLGVTAHIGQNYQTESIGNSDHCQSLVFEYIFHGHITCSTSPFTFQYLWITC